MKINRINKTLFISFILLCVYIIPLSAQNKSEADRKKQREEHWKEYMQDKMTYLIKATGMTKQESERFFPIYEEMMKKKFEVQRNMRKKLRTIESSKQTISEETYYEAAKTINESKYEEGKIDKEYFDKYKKILSPERLYKFEKAELDYFKDALGKNPKQQHHQKNK